MGMDFDIYGKAPKQPQGKGFHCPDLSWHPLADLCRQLAPDLAAACRSWHDKNGDGLEAEEAEQLALRLQNLLAAGKVAEYIRQRDAELARLRDENCPNCGTLNEAVSECGCCGGTGLVRPSVTYYTVTESDVSEWIAFLSCCGGFRIS